MAMRTEISISMPFLRILPVIVLGILAANAVKVPLYVPVIVLAASMVAAVIFRRKEWSSWLVALALLAFSMCGTYLTATKDVMPKDEKVIAALHITDNPQVSGHWAKATARVDKFRLAETVSEGAAKDAIWQKSGEKIVIRFDTAHHISVGDRIITEAYIRPVADSAYAGYMRLMRRRGYSASAWVYGNSETVILPDKARTPMYWASRMQAKANERMDRLRMKPDNLAVSKAMSIGARDELSPELRGTYSLTGASHLLAVSGLHVGIVAMLINALLWLLPVFRRGHLIKNIIAIAAVWLYAMLTGLSPSVLRAAMMFTGLQFALFSSQRGGGMNGLLGTAAVMLLINPNYLYDVSFQLSFMAVFGIFIIYGPLYGLVRTERKWLNAVWSVVLIGVAATIATAPLVSYYFGRIPVIGIFINPIVIITANIIVLFSMLWIIAPIGFLNGVFSWVIGGAAEAQNAVVGFSSSQTWASAAVQLSGWQVLFVYLTGAAILYLVWRQVFATRKPEYKV